MVLQRQGTTTLSSNDIKAPKAKEMRRLGGRKRVGGRCRCESLKSSNYEVLLIPGPNLTSQNTCSLDVYGGASISSSCDGDSNNTTAFSWFPAPSRPPIPHSPSSNLNTPRPHTSLHSHHLSPTSHSPQSPATMGIIRTLVNTAVLGGAGAGAGWAFCTCLYQY